MEGLYLSTLPGGAMASRCVLRWWCRRVLVAVNAMRCLCKRAVVEGVWALLVFHQKPCKVVAAYQKSLEKG